MVPVLLIVVAILSAATAVYGTLPHFAAFDGGLAFIEAVRRLQWPLLTLSVLLCFVLLVLVLVGKRRVWWLMGFGPVVAIFLQLFVTGTISTMKVVEDPPLVASAEANFLQDGDYVVGVSFGGKSYALPYRQLFNCPVTILSDRDRRVMVLWSAYANRALAYYINRQIKAKELDIVSLPANALLVYNGRVGEFFDGVTGLKRDGTRPYGVEGRIPVVTTTWVNWRARNPGTLVSNMPILSNALAGPVQPKFPMKSAAAQETQRQILFFPTTFPVAIAEDQIDSEPMNLVLDTLPAVIWRDAETGRVYAYERKFAGKVSRFIRNPSRAREGKGVYILDTLTNSGWTTAGVAVDGDNEIIGQKLTPITWFDQGLYLGVMRHWYPDLELVEPEAPEP